LLDLSDLFMLGKLVDFALKCHKLALHLLSCDTVLHNQQFFVFEIVFSLVFEHSLIHYFLLAELYFSHVVEMHDLIAESYDLIL